MLPELQDAATVRAGFQRAIQSSITLQDDISLAEIQASIISYPCGCLKGNCLLATTSLKTAVEIIYE